MHLKVVKVAHFMGCVFYHNLKNQGINEILSDHVLSYTVCIYHGGAQRGDHLTEFLEIREGPSWEA